MKTLQQFGDKPAKIYIDFDGTISKSDVLNAILKKYADPIWLDLDMQYLNGEISSRECLTKQIGLLCKVSDQNILEVAENIGIDGKFSDFIAFCGEHSIPTEILSDGMDIYIKHLLKINKIKVGDIKCNIYAGNGKILFPFEKRLCEKECGNCKKQHLDNKFFTIYIGDGKSDLCAAENSDLVFAKNSLAGYLKENSKDYVEYVDFGDIINFLKNIWEKP